MERKSSLEFLAGLEQQLAGFARPAWFINAVAAARALPVPDPGPLVLSHNDVNPTNLIYDGERVLLLDWDVAGLNSRYHDLAAASLFFRLDETRCLLVLSAHDGAPVTSLPARFVYDRILVGALVGSIFLKLAREGGHPGNANASPPRLADLYQRMRGGQLDPGSASGQFELGLALLEESRLP
jgi:aminoglycoside phosphotransferase (APT) family kinase protein